MKWKLFIIAILLVSSCKTSKQTETTPIYTPGKDDGKTDKDKDKELDGTDKDKLPDKEETVIDPIEEKKAYNIAIVLPFNVDKVPLNYLPYDIDTNIYISSFNSEALDFYMGAKLLIDEFKTKNKTINVFILDDAKNEAQANKILSERPFPNIDIIVSGSTNWISKKVLDYSVSNKIPLYSPFTTDIPKTYDWFFSALPNDHHLLEQLVVNAQSRYPESDIIIIEDKRDPSSSAIAKDIKSFIQSEIGKNAEVITNTDKIYSNKGDSLSFYQPTATNIVIVTSNDARFVKNTLHQIHHASFSTHIIGMPSWVELNGLENSTQPHPDIQIPIIKASSKAENVQVFSNKFVRSYKMKENRNAYMGYDLMNYILTSLDRGVLQKNPTTDDLQLSPVYYKFDFMPMSNKKDKNSFLNSQVKFLKYTKGKFGTSEK